MFFKIGRSIMLPVVSSERESLRRLVNTLLFSQILWRAVSQLGRILKMSYVSYA